MSTSSELVEDRDDHEIADLIARMEIDDAADLIGQFDGDRRTHILSHPPAPSAAPPARAALLRAPDRRRPDEPRVRRRLHPGNPKGALDRVRRAASSSDALDWIFTINTHRRYRGVISLRPRPRRAR
jgi:Mg/Co/Ni transporter MgtE